VLSSSDSLVIRQARSIISQATSSGTHSLENQYKKMVALFKTGKGAKDTRLQATRYKRFMKKHVVKDSPLEKSLKRLRKKLRHNGGNQAKGKGKAKTKGEVAENDTIMDALVETHGPTASGLPGPKFWLRWEKNSTKPEPNTRSVCGKETFPGGHFVFEAMPFMSVRERFKEPKYKKGTTAVKAKHYPHLSIQAVKGGNHSINVLPPNKKGKQRCVLARIHLIDESNKENWVNENDIKQCMCD